MRLSDVGKSYESRVHSSKGFVPILITGHLLATPGCQHWSEHYRTSVAKPLIVLGMFNPINSWPPPIDLLFLILSYNLSYCHKILALTIYILVVYLVCQMHSKWPQATHLPFNSPISPYVRVFNYSYSDILLLSFQQLSLSYPIILVALTVLVLVVYLVCQMHSKWPQATHLPFNSPISPYVRVFNYSYSDILLLSFQQLSLSYPIILVALTVLVLVVYLVCQLHSKWLHTTHLPSNSPICILTNITT